MPISAMGPPPQILAGLVPCSESAPALLGVPSVFLSLSRCCSCASKGIDHTHTQTHEHTRTLPIVGSVSTPEPRFPAWPPSATNPLRLTRMLLAARPVLLVVPWRPSRASETRLGPLLPLEKTLNSEQVSSGELIETKHLLVVQSPPSPPSPSYKKGGHLSTTNKHSNSLLDS